MKVHREVTWWLAIFVLSLVGFWMFLLFVHPVNADYRSGFSWMFDAGPAFFATTGGTAFFLMLRFFIKSPQNPSKTKFWHIEASLLISLAGVVTWEVTRHVLNEQVPLKPGSLLGAFVACFVVVLLWLFIRSRAEEKKNKTLPSNP